MMDAHSLEEVRQLVKAAAIQELMGRFESVDSDVKADGSLITAADLAMQDRLQRELGARWPHYA
ncbi:MAG: inositol monophosphatase, partial [Sedimenticolaceae bacterium]